MKVNSSIIDEIDYINGNMIVKFKNWTKYRYEAVQPDDHRKIITGKSIWSTFKEMVAKRKFKYSKI